MEKLSWADLAEIHRWAHLLINQVLDGLPPRKKIPAKIAAVAVEIGKFRKKIPQPVWLVVTPENSTVGHDFDLTKRDRQFALHSLWQAITERPFPFRSCPICRTVFVLAGKKKFCSPKCTAASIGPRIEYMRNYMAQKRARNALIKLKEESPRNPRIKELQAKYARLREAAVRDKKKETRK
jgi:hypothetical protein